MTNPVEHNGKLYVELPKDAANFQISDGHLYFDYIKNTKHDCIALPPETWQLIADTETITEQIASGLVDREFKEVDHRHAEFKQIPALTSFQTLLTSLGLGLIQRLVILKRIK